MHNFKTAVNIINTVIYEPNQLIIKSIVEEKQNANYAACKFKLGFGLTTERVTKTVRFRVARVTPTKIGQFVTFWEKDVNNTN